MLNFPVNNFSVMSGCFPGLNHRSLKFCLYITSIVSKPKAHNVITKYSNLLSESISQASFKGKNAGACGPLWLGNENKVSCSMSE